MNLLLLIVQMTLLLSGSQAAKLTHTADTQNVIQNEFQNNQRSDPHDNEESTEQQDEEKGLNQTVHAGQGNLVPISQSNFENLGGLRSELDNNRHGNQGIFNQDNTKQRNQNFSSIKSAQFHTQGLKDSVASSAAGVSQGATSFGNAEKNSIFFRTNQNGPQNFGPIEVHSNTQSGIRQETKLGFDSTQGTSQDTEESNQPPGTNAGFSQVDGSFGFDHVISNNGLSPGFDHNQGTSNFGFRVSQSDNSAISVHSHGTDSSLRTAQRSHETGSSHGASNTFVLGVSESDTELSPGIENNQGPSNFGFGVTQNDNSSIFGYNQVTDSGLRSDQASHATGSSHGNSNTFVRGLSGSEAGFSPGFGHNQGPSNFGFRFSQSDNSAITGHNQVTDSALKTDQALHATGSSHGTSNTFAHGVSGSDNRLSHGFEHNQGPSNFGFGVSQKVNSAISGNHQVTDMAFRTSQASHAIGSSHGTSNTLVHGISGSGFHQNTDVFNNAAIRTGFGQSTAILGDQFGQSTSGSAARFGKDNKIKHGQQNIGFNTGFNQGNIGASNAFNQEMSPHQNHANTRNGFNQGNIGASNAFNQEISSHQNHANTRIGFNQGNIGASNDFNQEISSPQNHANTRNGFNQGNIGASNAFNQEISSPQNHPNARNGFGQSVSNNAVRHRVPNQQNRSKPQIYKFNLVHESSGTVDNFNPLGQSTSVQSNIVGPNNIESLSTSRSSRAGSGFGGIRQTNLIQQTGRQVQPAQTPFRQNQVISSNPTFFGNRNPNSHVTQQHILGTSANQESANNASNQRNINSIESQREVNSLGVQTRQRVYNAVRQAGTSSQINQKPKLLPRNQLSQESIASDDAFNNQQSALGSPIIFDSQRQRLFSHGPSLSSNTGNKRFRGSTNSQITRQQTHLTTPNQSNPINQGSVRNFENESTETGQRIVHQRNEISPVDVVGARTPNESYNIPNLG